MESIEGYVAEMLRDIQGTRNEKLGARKKSQGLSSNVGVGD